MLSSMGFSAGIGVQTLSQIGFPLGIATSGNQRLCFLHLICGCCRWRRSGNIANWTLELRFQSTCQREDVIYNRWSSLAAIVTGAGEIMEFSPGDTVPTSGVYRVYHDSHRLMHEATLLADS